MAGVTVSATALAMEQGRNDLQELNQELRLTSAALARMRRVGVPFDGAHDRVTGADQAEVSTAGAREEFQPRHRLALLFPLRLPSASLTPWREAQHTTEL